MNQVPAQRAVSPLTQFKADLKRLKDAGELDMLPSNVSFEAFRNAAVVAITDNQEIMRCQKESIFKAIRRLAAAGLVPDGREAAIVPFKGQAQAMPMVAGLIKTARNSGEIISIWSDVVYEGEEFRVWIEDGERKFEHEHDPLRRGGEIVGAYAVAKLKDGTVEMEPMSKAEIEKRRKASANQKGEQPTGIWQQWYAEMARKTVIRALCKRLPISSEDMRRLYVEHEDTLPVRDVTPKEGPRRNLAQRILEPQEPEDGLDGEVMPPVDEMPVSEAENEPEDVDTDEAFPGSLEWDEGAKAFQAGKPINACPYKGGEQQVDWLGGWKGAKEAKEGAA